ncbi:cell division protein ZapA [Desulfonatronovibrio hydrogenovorans]|uniref:cell division protein ZapA n=1 Tax=Desulfonatronovibrio hydrogenovorans TaxID=53245 RepID=UPI00048D7D94|nr:cell division protein ZapA [Desulfonatronovibrio hydrogenovorans]
MPGYNINILGLDLTFRTDAGPERVEQASKLLEERFAELEKRGSKLSKERLLVFLALSLADDYLHSDQRLAELQAKVDEQLRKIDRLETKK